MTRTKLILWALPLLWIIATFLYIFVVRNGLNVPWKFLGKPSENISKIVGYNYQVGKFFVSTKTGKIYSLPYYHFGDLIPSPTLWTKDDTYKKELDPIYGKANATNVFLSPPTPFKLKLMYQFAFPGFEGTNINKFALSEDGDLWLWSAGGGVFKGVFNFLVLTIEILVYLLALLLYLVIYLTRRAGRKLKNQDMLSSVSVGWNSGLLAFLTV